ncbi:MAG: hypothetical protein JOZ33_17055 [Acidobacteriaceae bacterium]|nr:hypothetical protein [Acidobacteriaceae bacterium]
MNNCSSAGSSGTQIGDGGSATSATLQYPTDAKSDAAGNIYIADNGNVAVRVVYLQNPEPPILVQDKISASTGNIYTVAGIPGQYCGAQGICGDNGSALSATFANVTSLDIDSSGNLYIADAGSSFTTPVIGGTIRLVYAGGNPVPPLLKIATESPVAGDIYAIAGTESAACSAAGQCGVPGPALQAQFNIPNFVRIDAGGDTYIADTGACVIRKADAAGYISNIAGTESPGACATSPTGNGGPATSAGFSNPLNFAFDSQDNLYIADGTPDFVIWEALPALPQTITFNSLEPVTYGTPPIALTATASSGLPVSYSVTGPATLSTTPSGTDLTITGAGTVQVTASQQGNTQYGAAPSVTQSMTVNKALLTVTALPASITTKATQLPTFQAEFTGFVNGDSQKTAITGTPAFSTPAVLGKCGPYPINVSQGTLAAANYTFAFSPGTLTITGDAGQTITFLPPGTATYGQTPTVALKAQASSGLPVDFTVISGPATVSGSTLQITGGGVITIEAYQPGNCSYAAATVTQTLTVNPAPLTVTGPAVSLPYATTVNPAQFPPPTITGFVGGDTQAIVTGNAQYSTVSGTPQPGTYPIQVSQGTLALAPGYRSNYTFASFVPGQLTVTTASQSINFTQIPPFTVYGSSVTLMATASSGLPVVFSLTGPATFFANQNATNPGAGINTVTLNLTGVGAVTVTATQSGNAVYDAAQQVPQTFTVTPAVLTISANSATRTYGVANPTLTYLISNFVNGDGDVPRVITGIPYLSTTATQQSPPGDYPIVITQGTLFAPNYTFNLVNGTLTVLPAGNYTLAASPPSLSIQSGHSGQTTIVITPNNDYQGTITLSCGSLPADISCIFSPTTYSFNGNTNGGLENPLQGTLTITTLGGQTVVGALSQPPTPSGGPTHGLLIWAGLTGLLITGSRKRLKNTRIWRLVIVITLSLGALTLASCGSGNTAALAAPGTATITINGVDAQNVASSTSLTVTIQ